MAAKFNDLQLVEMANENDTPLYVYDLTALKSRIEKTRAAFSDPHFELLFATMANPEPQILRTIAAMGVGACVNSISHLRLTLENGFDKSQIQFTSTGIKQCDMMVLSQMGIAVNIDSQAQVVEWSRIKRSKIGVRINAKSLGQLQSGDRIGISAAELPEVLRLARQLKIEVNGLHIYVGTNFQAPELMIPTLTAFFELAESVPTLEYINIGGGIGVDYSHVHSDFDLQTFGSSVTALVRRLRDRLRRPIRLIFEPGRSLVASSGIFLARVTDIKTLLGVTYVAVDASVSIFPRPFHHPESSHIVRRLGSEFQSGEENQAVVVVGRTTFSKDILACSQLPLGLTIGDFLVFEDAGAYSFSMGSRFLGQAEPCSLFLN